LDDEEFVENKISYSSVHTTGTCLHYTWTRWRPVFTAGKHSP